MDHATPAAILFIFIFSGPLLYYIFRAKGGWRPFIRRIPGIDAIDEAVGRAVELGRPMSFTTGPLVSIGPLLYAALGVLRHIGKKAAIYNTRLFVPCADPEVLVISDATLQSAYHSEKKFANYDPTSVRFLSSEQFAYASGYMGMMHREKVASAFLFGAFAAESLILAESGQQVGAIQVAATVSNEQIPFFITACDYTLIGEELFAAGAFLSDDSVQTGSLRGQDIAKLFIVALIVLGTSMATFYAATDEKSQSPLSSWIHKDWKDVFEPKE